MRGAALITMTRIIVPRFNEKKRFDPVADYEAESVPRPDRVQRLFSRVLRYECAFTSGSQAPAWEPVALGSARELWCATPRSNWCTIGDAFGTHGLVQQSEAEPRPAHWEA